MGIQRADLHMHGPIGFQPYWLEKQGYAGQNILQLMTDQALAKGITVCAITSQKHVIPRLSVDDRLGIVREIEAPLLPSKYRSGTLGGKNNVVVVERDSRQVYFVSGQTVMPKEGTKEYDLLVIGANDLKSGRTFRDTLTECKDRKLIAIAEHPYIETHRGMGDLLEHHINDFDAIEGHNAQAIFPAWMAHVPVLGNYFSRAGKSQNTRAQIVAEKYNKPWIATSDAHRIEDLGIAYIEWTGDLETRSEEAFLAQLKSQIQEKQFTNNLGYENWFAWVGWVKTFMQGIKEDSGLEDIYIPSNKF